MKWIVFIIICGPLFLSTALAKSQVDLVVIEKAQRRIYLKYKGKIVKTYTVALGSNPKGHKVQEGDGKTPEGAYRVNLKTRHSQYYKSVKISYPNKKDRQVARSLGVSPGGNIRIHGMPTNIAKFPDYIREMIYYITDFEAASKMINTYWDWTQGCIAVTNEQMDEIYQFVSKGTKVQINP